MTRQAIEEPMAELNTWYFMKIYTRTGDSGSTGLFGGPRVAKDDARIEAYGTVDELNATLGVARADGSDPQLNEHLSIVQHELFSIGAELASPDPDAHQLRIINDRHIARLEQWIDQYEAELPPLKNFILPAGDPAAASLHLARAVCRRAERRVVTLANRPDATISEDLVVYLNRLSDWLFVVSRVANLRASVPEVAWERPEMS